MEPVAAPTAAPSVGAPAAEEAPAAAGGGGGGGDGSPRQSAGPPAATEKPKCGQANHCQVVIGAGFDGAPIYCPAQVASRTSKVMGAFVGGEPHLAPRPLLTSPPPPSSF